MQESDPAFTSDDALQQVLDVAAECLRSGNSIHQVLNRTLEAAISISRADKGTLQVLDKQGEALKLTAQRGFEEPFCTFFETVKAQDSSACSAVMQGFGEQLVEDVLNSEIYAGQPSLQVLLDADVRAVTSIPLLSTNTQLLGVFSVHFGRPHRPSERDLALLRLLARQTADFLERRQTEDSLGRSESLLRTILESVPEGIYAKDAQSRLVLVNTAGLKAVGKPADQILGRDDRAFYDDPAIGEAIIANDRRVMATGVPETFEETLLTPQGYREYLDTKVPWRDGGGEVIGIIGIARDVTEKKQAEQKLRASEERLRLAQLSTNVGVWDWDVRTGELTWTPELEMLYGLEPGSVVSYEDFRRRVHPDDLAEAEAVRDAAIQTHKQFDCEFRMIHPSGEIRWVRALGRAFYDDAGQPIRVIGNNIDITQKKLAEEALRHNQRVFSELIERAPFGIYVVDSQFRIVSMNANAQEGAFRGVRPIVGRDIGEAIRILWPEPVAEEVVNIFRHTLETGEPYQSRDFINSRRDVDAVESYEWELHRITLPDQQHGLICYYFDSTALRGAERKLRERTEELQVVWDHAPAMIWMAHDAECRRVTGNEAACRFLGVQPGENVSATPQDEASRVLRHFDATGRELDPSELPLQRAAATGQSVENREVEMLLPDGRRAWIWGNAVPLFSADGRVRGAISSFFDVTVQKQMESALRTNERMALAGRLSATIAHEIHNPLDTVGNILFLLAQKVGDQPEVRQLIEAAKSEVSRAAEISRNMLSLHRESRSMSSVNLAGLIDETVRFIENTLVHGTRRIRVKHGYYGELDAFPSELRQLFTNVLKNAVDATGPGGNILIESRPRLESWQEGVLIEVRDDGVGVPPDLLSKLFNPFVTSKGEKGTGLGLWVSRSIAQKHGGQIHITNNDHGTPGTTVSIFLRLSMKSEGALQEA